MEGEEGAGGEEAERERERAAGEMGSSVALSVIPLASSLIALSRSLSSSLSRSRSSSRSSAVFVLMLICPTYSPVFSSTLVPECPASVLICAYHVPSGATTRANQYGHGGVCCTSVRCAY
eukprot:3245050-Rhodomonas_salina.2